MKIDIKKIMRNVGSKKIIGLFFLLFTIFSFIALLNFNPLDSSWFYFNSENNIITNKLGFFGSNLAATLLYLFGPTIIIFLFFLIYLTIFLISDIEFKLEWERFFAFIFSIFIFAVLFDYHKITLFDYHGIIGNLISKNFLYKFNKQIIITCIYSSLFISFILITRFCFVSIYSPLKLKRIIFYFDYLLSFLKILKKIVVNPFYKINNFIIELIRPNEELDELLFEEEYGHLFNNYEQNLTDDFWNQFTQSKKELEGEEIFSATKVNEDNKTLPNLNEIFEVVDDNFDNKKIIKESEIQAKILEEKLKCFGILGSVISIKYGPVITLFEYEPHIDSKISKIISLEDDLAMALETTSIRIIAPIPGKSVVGFEIANKNRRNVLISQIIKSSLYQNFSSSLPLILGEDVIGNKVIVDLIKMPHLLIAGSTGSGKSVALNTMIVGLLCKCSPIKLKLILIDPKRLEFTPYNDIAHLLFPIITLPQYAIAALKWLIKEMENRYEMMAKVGSKNIVDYNNYCKKNNINEFPFIVVIIDELADLMMTAGKDIEDSIIRIAQMARACGIHMIVATQRPSVDVITGLIKVNFPSRISFKVASKIDSRTILDCAGADKLLGKGDMLFQSSQSSHLERLHGAYVSDETICKVVNHIRSQYKVEYLNLIEISNNLKQDLSDSDDQLYKDIIIFLNEIDEVSISLLQRRFKIGYNRSARIIEMLELQGYVLPSESGRARKVIKAHK